MDRNGAKVGRVWMMVTLGVAMTAGFSGEATAQEAGTGAVQDLSAGIGVPGRYPPDDAASDSSAQGEADSDAADESESPAETRRQDTPAEAGTTEEAGTAEEDGSLGATADGVPTLALPEPSAHAGQPSGYDSLTSPSYQLGAPANLHHELSTIPEGGAGYSYWPGLLGMLVGTGAGLGAAALGFVSAVYDNNTTAAISLWVAAPVIQVMGPAVGVWLHGRRAGGMGTFGHALLGSFLGGLGSWAMTLAFPPLGIPLSLVLMPLATSALYWRGSRRRVQELEEASRGLRVVPTFSVDDSSVFLGASGRF